MRFVYYSQSHKTCTTYCAGKARTGLILEKITATGMLLFGATRGKINIIQISCKINCLLHETTAFLLSEFITLDMCMFRS